MSRLLVLYVLAGCNQLLGLDQTYTAAQDIDGDHVLDVDDNCPAVANPDQADRDRDGVGDACDGCVEQAGGPMHDEDGDRRWDGCDVCPSIADFQADADGDGVGDVCENFAPSTRLLFDGFGELSDEWIADAPWQLVGDSVAPVQPLALRDLGLEHRDLMLTEPLWSIRAGYAAKERWQSGDRFGIVLRDQSGGEVASCMITCATTCSVLAAVPDVPSYAAPVEAMPLARLTFFVVPGYSGIACGVEGSPPSYVALTAPIGGTPTFVATPAIHLAYVDIVEQR